jgi:hypothetical protein
MNEQINQYIENAPDQQKLIMQKIREILHEEVSGITENFKWERPVFSTSSDFVYFKTTKAYLTFGVFKAEKIKTEAQLLEGTGKDMRHIKLKKIEDLNLSTLKQWLHELTS